MVRTRTTRAGAPVVRYIAGEPAYAVHRVCDRIGNCYRVLWVGGSTSLEPADRIHVDFADESWFYEVADRWVAAGRPGTFEAFYTADGDAGGFTASDDNLCGFNAIRAATRLLGAPSTIPEELVQQFVDLGRTQYGRDLRLGASKKVLNAFARFVQRNGRNFNARVFAQNLVQQSITGTAQFQALPLETGIYVFGAYTRHQVGHCAVLIVSQHVRMIFDDSVDEGHDQMAHLHEATWIANVAFVSRVLLGWY